MPQLNWICLSPGPLDAGLAIQFVADPRAGGIAVFLGSTRAETSSTGQNLAALDYEAYGEMASQQLADLGSRARERGPVLKLAILHRTGRVLIGEPSVIVAVSTPHRGEAFDICHWIIDTLKAEVTIWKKEIWDDGSGTWKNPI